MILFTSVLLIALVAFRKPLQEFAKGIGEPKSDISKMVTSLMGTKEYPTKIESNPKINAWFRVLGYQTLKDDTPWCGAFVGYVLKSLGYEIPRQPLRARAFEGMGQSIGLNDAQKYHSVVVFWRKTRTSGLGHVGFYVSHDATHVTVAGGNQNDEVNDTLRLPIARLTEVFNPVKLV